MSQLFEKIQLQKLLGKQPRSKNQINKLFEADCEILKLGKKFLCSSVDSIGEEIQVGLYQNPETWGWMAVMASVSDLAASGALPLGLLISTQWGSQLNDEKKQACFAGVAKALKKTKIPLLGGDSGSGSETVLNSTILGEALRRPLTRLGIQKDDLLVLIGKNTLGLGPAFGFQFLQSPASLLISENQFRPTPNPWLISRVRPLCHAAIDTSDGLATSLGILSELNRVGFEVSLGKDSFHPLALKTCQALGLHPHLLLMGEHGDYQTLLAVSPKNLKALQKLTRDFVVIAKAVTAKKVSLVTESRKIVLPTEQLTSARARNLSDIRRVLADMNDYFHA